MQTHSTWRTLWRFLRPEPEELAAYVVIILTMLGLAIYHVAVQGKIGVESQDIITSLGSAKETLLSFTSRDDSWGAYALFGLWLVIGAAVYMIAWALITFIIDVNRDIEVSSSFVHPKSFHQSEYWTSIIMRGLLRGAGGIALILYTIFWATALAPVWLVSFEALFGNGVNQTHVLDSLAALFGIALSLHIAAILLRVMLLRSHYSYER
jgi:hypothetical protein